MRQIAEGVLTYQSKISAFRSVSCLAMRAAETYIRKTKTERDVFLFDWRFPFSLSSLFLFDWRVPIWNIHARNHYEYRVIEELERSCALGTSPHMGFTLALALPEQVNMRSDHF